MTLTKAIDTARAHVSRDGRRTSIYDRDMRLWHETQHATAAYARLYARGALIAHALLELGADGHTVACVINASPDTGRWESIVRDWSANR